MRREVFALAASLGIVCVACAQEPAKTEVTTKPVAATATTQPATTEAAKPDATDAAKPAGGPKIEFASTVYDFGTTSQVESVSGKFTFKNTGDGVLELKKPTTSCGCTVASLKPDTLKPGESGELAFTMTVGMSRGHLEKHITVPSNDAQNPSVNLTVKTEIKPTYELNPQQVSLGDLRQGTTTNAVVDIKRVDGKKLVVSKTEASNPEVTAKVEPGTNAEEQAAKLMIEFKADGVPRRFGDTVKVFTDESEKPSFMISVFGRVLGDISLTPEALFWGISDPENWPGASPEVMTTRRVLVAATRDEPLEVHDLVSSLKELSLEVTTVETGKTYQVVAKLSEAPKESTRGTISFATNYASQPKIEVPVIINVMKR